MSELLSSLLKAPRYLPLVLLVLLMAPVWLTWIYLSDKKQASALAMVGELRLWAVGNEGQLGTPSALKAIESPRDELGPARSDV